MSAGNQTNSDPPELKSAVLIQRPVWFPTANGGLCPFDLNISACVRVFSSDLYCCFLSFSCVSKQKNYSPATTEAWVAVSGLDKCPQRWMDGWEASEGSDPGHWRRLLIGLLCFYTAAWKHKYRDTIFSQHYKSSVSNHFSRAYRSMVRPSSLSCGHFVPFSSEQRDDGKRRERLMQQRSPGATSLVYSSTQKLLSVSSAATHELLSVRNPKNSW